MLNARFLGTALLAVCVVVACSDIRHPLDDSETKPETEELALAEATEVLDVIGPALFDDATYDEDVWTGEDGCSTASFAPSQGEVGVVVIRRYESVNLAAGPDALIEGFEAYWDEEDVSASRSSPNMDPGAVSRVDGIGYEIVSVSGALELRAFIPCY